MTRKAWMLSSPPPPILKPITGMASIHPLSMLSYYSPSHIIHSNQLPLQIAVNDRPKSPYAILHHLSSNLINTPCTAYLSFRGEKRKGRKGRKTNYTRKKTRRQESTGREKLNDRTKTANYKPELLTTIELFSP